MADEKNTQILNGVCVKRSRYMAFVNLFEGQPQPAYGGFCVFAEIGDFNVTENCRVSVQQLPNGNYCIVGAANG